MVTIGIFTLIGIVLGFIGGSTVGVYYFRLGLAQKTGEKEPEKPLLVDPLQAFFAAEPVNDGKAEEEDYYVNMFDEYLNGPGGES